MTSGGGVFLGTGLTAVTGGGEVAVRSFEALRGMYVREGVF